jgi:transposase
MNKKRKNENQNRNSNSNSTGNDNDNHSKQEILKKRRCLNPKPRQVKDELFEKYSFFDSNDLIQVKYEMIRRVNKHGWSIKKAAKAFGLSRPSFYKAKKAFEQQGITGLIPEKTGPKEPHKLSREVIEYLEKLQDQTPKLKAQTLTERINEKFEVMIDTRSIYRALGKLKKKKRKKQKT